MKRLLSVLLVTIAVLMPTKSWAADGVSEPYAVLSADGLTVTFYYDDQRTTRGGIDIINSNLDENTNSPYGTATTAIIDASFADYRPTSTACWFLKCSSLTNITGMENLKTDNVTNMGYMFNSCSGMTSLDLSNFNTANVTNMGAMFSGCSGLTSLNVKSFNTQNVTNMNSMFSGCSSLTDLDVSSFNTSNVTDMNFMFSGCYKLTSLDVTGFNTANVTTMGYIFANCLSLTSLDVTSFNTSKMTSLVGLFLGCSGLTSIDVSRFDTSNVGSMYGLFNGCSRLKRLDLSNFNTANATSMLYMFANCSSLVDLNISSFVTSNVLEGYLDDMFKSCSSLASIQVGNAAIPDSIYADIENPNLLVYVNEASLAPSGVQNVVVNGTAREIVLTDATSGNNNFYVPQAFTAERISYTRNFAQSTQVGVSRGWESIALPFDVQTITHETKGTIAPFGNTASNRHFWLRELGSNGLQSATGIAANTPYVISMPNSSDYTDSYNLAGRVTFAAENATIPVTEVKATAMADESIVMIPTMQRQERSSAVWALNVGEVRGRYLEGSVFERDYREVRPFEAFTVHREENTQPAPRYVPLQEIGGTTGIHMMEDVRSKKDDVWYTTDGRKLQGKPNAKGVYINNGQKIVIR